jgi:hypothetical protein
MNWKKLGVQWVAQVVERPKASSARLDWRPRLWEANFLVRQLQTNPGVRLQTGTIVSLLLFLSSVRPEFLLQYVPVRFGSSHLTVDDQFVELQTADGKQWDAWCCGHSASCSSKNISWASFTRGSDLATGGVCVSLSWSR